MAEVAIPWALSDRESVEQEAAPYREVTAGQRLAALQAACRAAMRLLNARDDRRSVLDHVDPLPESSVRVLERLRRRKRRGSPGE